MSNTEKIADIIAGMRDPENDYITNNDLRDLADRIEAAAEREQNRQHEPKCNWSIRDALALANTLANHGLRDGNADAASSCIYALCRHLRIGRNATALREALVEARKVIEAMGGYWAEKTLPIIDAALAAPARNCDVGTAVEQQERFREFCRRHKAAGECGMGLTQAKCSCWRGPKNPDCALVWAQMPYEAEGGAECER